MIVTFDPVLPKTVPSTYSWDSGVPSAGSSSLVDLTIDSDGYYVGYAPFVFVRLSSAPLFEEYEEDPVYVEDNVYTIFRRINFGDYYNCAFNELTSLGFDENYYCHTYVMPGAYEAYMAYTPYVTAADTGEQPGIAYQQEGIDPYEAAPILELISESDRGRINWSWNGLTCAPSEICDTGLTDSDNTPIKWNEAKCGEDYQKTWKSIQGACFEAPLVLEPQSFRITEKIFWKWEHLSCTNETDSSIKWTDTKCGFYSSYPRTWKDVSDTCTETLTAATKKPEPSKIKIKVIELTPTAYLSAIQPDQLDRVSPLSATLTARFTKCGSFPIEKIVWDLGDGSPLLTQRRWDVLSSDPFVYTGALPNDRKDPRNYDLKHTYRVTKDSGFTFYPSITAYAYSTGTTDCASTIIGPVQPQSCDSANITLLQSNISDQRKFSMLLQVDDNIVAAKFEK